VDHRNLLCSALRGLRCLPLNVRPALMVCLFVLLVKVVVTSHDFLKLSVCTTLFDFRSMPQMDSLKSVFRSIYGTWYEIGKHIRDTLISIVKKVALYNAD
jgi:hypothetical protein